jgi:hypothetical protein
MDDTQSEADVGKSITINDKALLSVSFKST